MPEVTAEVEATIDVEIRCGLCSNYIGPSECEADGDRVTVSCEKCDAKIQELEAKIDELEFEIEQAAGTQ